MRHILGISMGHDSSVAYLKDGQTVFCLAEERLTRKKMFYGFPVLSLEYLLAEYDLSPADFDVVAIATRKLARIIGPSDMRGRFQRGGVRRVDQMLDKAQKVANYVLGNRLTSSPDAWEDAAREVRNREMEKLGFRREQIREYDHHAAHAASAVWSSPFDDALYVTLDGRGDRLSGTVGFAKGLKLTRTHAIADTDSLGQFYSAVTKFLGFIPNRHEGKVTGLAAHGDKDVLGPLFYGNVTWEDDGAFHFRLPEKYSMHGMETPKDFCERIALPLKDRVVLNNIRDEGELVYTANWYGKRAYLHDVARGASKEDVSAGVQFLTEQVCGQIVERNLPAAPTPVVMAGGVFANVRANQVIQELQGVTNIFVQPGMGDVGLSLGAALLAHTEFEQQASTLGRPSPLADVYLGPAYGDAEILSACAAEGVKATRMDDVEKAIGAWLHEGLIVGFFHGRMEFGPRSLGHRSILARPIDKGINQELNKRLNRTEFMPFAPSILSDHAAEYLIGYTHEHIAAQYMTVTYNVVPAKQQQIEAVVHIDGTARPQVVHEHISPMYYNVIREYYKQSGIPVVINTSFNAHEEPIVCTPSDAIRSLKDNCVDVLVMENYVVFKSDVK